jgi:FlaA1/EpsC-like NDP-sugar epimerase
MKNEISEDYKKIFNNKVVLITGGTGYLGRALTKEILKYNPKSIRILSRDEVKHHQMQEMFNYDDHLRHFIGDVRDYERLKKATKGVDIVIHAAALKRIDMIEYNVEEAIKTNIIGSVNVVNACLQNDVEIAIMVSTDKACAPVNTYGATKFVAERIFIESNFSKGKAKTKFICVRYGNVLESTGSVIPFFEEKIKAGCKIPLTDDRMTRFIISPVDAVYHIFKAIKYGIGGEVFVPILPAFKITDLIDILKEKHHANNEVVNIGIRPGEKIHEQMVNSAEIPRTFRFKDMYVITSQIQEYVSVDKPEYYTEKNRISEKEMEDYCSKDTLKSKEEVKAIFKKLGLI